MFKTITTALNKAIGDENGLRTPQFGCMVNFIDI